MTGLEYDPTSGKRTCKADPPADGTVQEPAREPTSSRAGFAGDLIQRLHIPTFSTGITKPWRNTAGNSRIAPSPVLRLGRGNQSPRANETKLLADIGHGNGSYERSVLGLQPVVLSTWRPSFRATNLLRMQPAATSHHGTNLFRPLASTPPASVYAAAGPKTSSGRESLGSRSLAFPSRSHLAPSY